MSKSYLIPEILLVLLVAGIAFIAGISITKEQNENIAIFHTALDKYLQRDFANAGKLFMQANSIGNGDPIALIFADRCKNFLENGVDKDWDGVINMTSK